MSSLNSVQLIGRLGQDPESRAMPSGGAAVNLSLATSEQWKDKHTGEKKERTEWHRIVFFGRIGEVCTEYLHKGDMIFVSGSIRTRKWQDKQGQERYSTEIVGSEMKMLVTNGGKTSDRQGNSGPSRPSGRNNVPPPREPATSGGDRYEDFDDDIPF